MRTNHPLMRWFSAARKADDESGFTLIEIVVALGIVMVVFAAIGAALVQNLAAQRFSTATTGANQAARQALASATTGGWANEGFYQNDPGVVLAAPNTEPTVILGATAPTPRPANVPLPTSTLTVGSYNYTVKTYITWVKDAAHGANPPAAPTAPAVGYKRVLVNVTFTVNSRTTQLNEQRIISPPTASGTGSSCDPQVTAPTCSVAATQGYVSTSASTTALVTSTPVNVYASYVSGTTVTAVSFLYYDGAGTQRTLALAATDGTNLTWSGTLPVGTSLGGGNPQTTQTVAVNGGTPVATQNVSMLFLTSTGA